MRTSTAIFLAVLVVTVSVTTSAQTLLTQTQTPPTPIPPQRSIEDVEKRLTSQVESVMFMIKLAGGVLSVVGLALGAWGIGSYRVLLKEIKEGFESRTRTLDERIAELDENLQRSKDLVSAAEKTLGLHEQAMSAVLLAQAEEAVTSEPPDIPKAVGFLAKLALDANASADELAHAGLFARERLGNSPLAKRLLTLAVQKKEPSDLSRVI